MEKITISKLLMFAGVPLVGLIGWLFQDILFSSNASLIKEKATLDYINQELKTDKNELSMKNRELQNELTNAKILISGYESGLKEKQLETSITISRTESNTAKTVSQNELLTMIISACISASTAGEKAETVIESGYSVANPVVAITPLALRQNGADVLKECLDVYYKSTKDHNLSPQ